MANFYWQSIKLFSKIAMGLTDMLKGNNINHGNFVDSITSY